MAGRALEEIYLALKVARDDDLSNEIWSEVQPRLGPRVSGQRGHARPVELYVNARWRTTGEKLSGGRLPPIIALFRRRLFGLLNGSNSYSRCADDAAELEVGSDGSAIARSRRDTTSAITSR